MRMFKGLAAGLLFVGGLFASGSAFATAGGQAMMCQGQVSVATAGPRTIGGTIGGTATNIPSGTLYTLNANGCTLVQKQDVGYFQALGFSFAGDGGVILFSVLTTATGTTSYQVGTLPPGAYIKGFFFQNTDATHAVTGGITCGTAAADTSIIGTALAIGTSSVGFETDALLLKRVFSTTATQAIFCQAVTSWNTPTTVTLTIPYGFF